MSVFGSIKDFLFGKKFITIGRSGAAQAATPNPSQPAPAAATPTPAAQASAPAPAATPTAAPNESVDIAAILDQEAKEAGQTLNWRQSIVDLMKLCGIDSSLQKRKELAHELGYTGNSDDSAAMNIWLHKAVLKKLEESGGNVPTDLKD